jgi:hypothetical protein
MLLCKMLPYAAYMPHLRLPSRPGPRHCCQSNEEFCSAQQPQLTELKHVERAAADRNACHCQSRLPRSCQKPQRSVIMGPEENQGDGGSRGSQAP